VSDSVVAGLSASLATTPEEARGLLVGVLASIGSANLRLNAVVTASTDRAERRIETLPAERPNDQPLFGLPVLVKDNICTRDIDTTCASEILRGWKPPYDATVITKLESAGAAIVGKTNMDEFGMGSSTEFSMFGPTKNPYDLERIAGGSSGGSAAAVAGGIVRAALGSDTGGSVRQPAAHCGVVGMKPTYGRVSRYGLIAYASSLDQVGVIGADVATTAALFTAIAGHDERDSTSLRDPIPDLNVELRKGAQGLRVGVVTELLGEGVQPEVAAAVRGAAEELEKQGAIVSPVSLPAARLGISAYYLIACAEASSNLARYDGVRFGQRQPGDNVEAMMVKTRSEGFGAEVKRRIILGTFVLSAGYQDQYYTKGQKVRTLLINEVQQAFLAFDVLLMPTSPVTAFRLGEMVDDPLQMYLTDVCTVLANLTGTPAISVPWGTDATGLPIGIQVMAPMLGEPTLFRAAAAMEALAPAMPRPPGFH
jgi:aspartyl-tRNA(Asn)/glutamyl-tRNA(Gln) amidotransferase subunit A